MTHHVVNCVPGTQRDSDAVPKCIAHRAARAVAQARHGINGAPQSVETVTTVFGKKIIVKITSVIVCGVDVGVTGRALRLRPHRSGRNDGGVVRIKRAAVARIGNLAEVQRDITVARIDPDTFAHRITARFHKPCQDRLLGFTLNETDVKNLQ